MPRKGLVKAPGKTYSTIDGVPARCHRRDDPTTVPPGSGIRGPVRRNTPAPARAGDSRPAGVTAHMTSTRLFPPVHRTPGRATAVALTWIVCALAALVLGPAASARADVGPG